ncbi:IclR family transcriptional regulator [Roseibium sp. CAU 1637]|uniref:IclR family transcriptional regulator n=1 Tax=Roseibium limicola TaxID=2816037 RepID=A0A939J850_9HYPH|nr:IclR family transcriptional regulator [Roseibium limicola]MBO0344499.1 IclR family transcriptional regulator [Roseibium limicola]
MSPKFLRSLQSNRPDLPEAEKDPLYVQSLGRAMQVLSAFHQTDKPLTLQEIATISGVGRSAVQRMVFTLRAMGYVDRDPDDRGYVPGLRILDHTLDFQRLNPVVVKAAPVLLELRRMARERIDLSLWDDLRLVYASRLQSKREILSSTLIGHKVPLFCTSGGWAILAHLTDAEADALLTRSDRTQCTPKTITDIKQLKREIAKAREKGYAVAHEQILSGEIAMAAAILDANRRPVAAIHLAASLAEWSPEEFEKQFAPLIIQAARTVSRA